LKALIEGAEPVDRFYGESLGIVLAHELVSLGSGGACVDAVRGGLARWQQRVVASYIDEHVADEIPLAAMTQLVGLSPYHFSRVFQADIWYTAPSIPHTPSHRTDEITVEESHGFGHVCWNGRGVLGNKLVLDGLSKGDRHDPERFSEKRLTSRERRAQRQPKPGTSAGFRNSAPPHGGRIAAFLL
jgi:hypothetical protein